MEISVKFACPEILGDLKNGTYNLEENSNVRELLSVCEEECSFKVNEDHLQWLLVLVNGRQTNWITPLTEGNRVIFLRGAMGG